MTEIEEKLNFIYQHSEKMVRSAEIRNAGLIIFNSVAIVASVVIVTSVGFALYLAEARFNGIYAAILFYLALFILMNIGSLSIALWSFLENVGSGKVRSKNTESDNWLLSEMLYKHLAEDDYTELCARYNIGATNSPFETDIAKRAATVSQIASTKLRYFNAGLHFTIAAIITPVVWLIIQSGIYAELRNESTVPKPAEEVQVEESK